MFRCPCCESVVATVDLHFVATVVCAPVDEPFRMQVFIDELLKLLVLSLLRTITVATT